MHSAQSALFRSRARARASTPTRALRCARLLCAAWLASSSSACFIWTSSGEGDKLREDVDKHAARILEIEKAQNDQLEQLRQAEKKAQKSIDELEGVIERATSVVQRNSADVTVQVSELQTKLAVVEGRMAELQYAIEELKKGGSRGGVASAGGESGAGGEAVPPADTRPRPTRTSTTPPPTAPTAIATSTRRATCSAPSSSATSRTPRRTTRSTGSGRATWWRTGLPRRWPSCAR
jgi:hypothetical protein